MSLSEVHGLAFAIVPQLDSDLAVFARCTALWLGGVLASIVKMVLLLCLVFLSIGENITKIFLFFSH